jgi:hypothetical protein
MAFIFGAQPVIQHILHSGALYRNNPIGGKSIGGWRAADEVSSVYKGDGILGVGGGGEQAVGSKQ